MIKFEKVRFKNFGSFGNNFTEIILDANNTTLICGNNGSGKSFAFLDSIAFALFGKPFRKINIPQLANSINNKNCLVEIEFSKGVDKYMVRRGINPRLFEIYKNGDILNQDAKSADYQEILENQIIKMNYKTFTQVVILGSSSFVPFMQLSAADRRSVIENILDINVFSTMNIVLKGKILSLKETLKEISTKLEIDKNKISTQKSYILSLEKKNNEDTNEKIERINEYKQKIESIKTDFLCQHLSDENFVRELELLETQIDDENKKYKKLLSANEKIIAQIEEKEKENTFFKENNVCKTCTQSITESIKKEKVLLNNVQISELNELVTTLSNKITENQETIAHATSTVKRIKIEYINYKNKVKEIEAYENEIKRIESSMNKSSIVGDIQQEKEKLIAMESSYVTLEEERDVHANDMMYHEYVNDLLRDGGVKAKIIKYYLPHMNKFINKFLASMDFYVQFHMDEEFNEQIKSRHRDEFSYMNFSEGEKMRIDLALLLAWREIARMKNSVSCNLLILDEVFDSSLDSVGMDELMKLLKVVSDRANVYVISHKSDQLVDKFSNIVTFEKKNNFSKMINT